VEIQLQVLVDPKVNGLVKDAISFETGLTRAQAADPHLYAYEHHGAEFTLVDPGALWSFYEDVLLGRPLPEKFVTRTLENFDTLYAITLFLHRDLVTHPATPGLLASVDLAHRRGIQGLAHLAPDLVNFLVMVTLLFTRETSKKEQGEQLRTVVGWIYEHVTEDRLPHVGQQLPTATILETGTNGFVVAEGRGRLNLTWIDLYRQGYLRGVLLGPPGKAGHREVLGSRKSVYVPFNLVQAASLLNQIEAALGQPPEWTADELWLRSPPTGTLIDIPHLMEVFLRV
jgi:hypothetical protein